MCQWTGSALVQVMACRLFGAKPLPEPMLSYCQLYSWEQISVKLESKFCHFHPRKCIWKCCLPKWQPFCPGRDEVTTVLVRAWMSIDIHLFYVDVITYPCYNDIMGQITPVTWTTAIIMYVLYMNVMVKWYVHIWITNTERYSLKYMNQNSIVGQQQNYQLVLNENCHKLDHYFFYHLRNVSMF